LKKEVKVVGVQFDIKSAVDDGTAGRDWNVDYMVKKIEQYGKDNDLIVFPELANCGYIRALEHTSNFRKDFYKNSAEDYPDGYTAQQISEACKKVSCYAVVGFLQRSEIKYEVYNSSMLIGPNGPLGLYQKVHIPSEELHYFIPGPGFKVFDTELGKIGLQICYDMWFPESTRILALQGAEIVVEIANWFEVKNLVWMWVNAPVIRAIENQVHFIAVNRVGDFQVRPAAPKGHLPGRSRIVTGYGDIVAESTYDKEDVIIGTLTEEDLEKGAFVLPTFRDRTPHAYDIITRYTHKWGH
jgi:predicted amidohydrolase